MSVSFSRPVGQSISVSENDYDITMIKTGRPFVVFGSEPLKA